MAKITTIKSQAIGQAPTYQVEVKHKDYPLQVETLEQKKDAIDWGREVEREMRAGTYRVNPARMMRFRQAAQNWLHNAPLKDQEFIQKRLDILAEIKLYSYPFEREINLFDIRIMDFHRALMRDVLKKIQRSENLLETDNQKKGYSATELRSFFTIIHKSWLFATKFDEAESPIEFIFNNPALTENRVVRLTPEVEDRLKADSPYELSLAIDLILYTAIRREEMCNLAWRNFDAEDHTIAVINSPNKKLPTRIIPIPRFLSDKLIQKNKNDSLTNTDDKIFQFKNPNAFSKKFEDVLKLAGISDLTLTDLRNEAIFRMYEAEVNSNDIMYLTGIKNMNSLMKFLDEENLLKSIKEKFAQFPADQRELDFIKNGRPEEVVVHAAI